MKRDYYDGLTINIPAFLVKEIEDDIKKEGLSPNLQLITSKVNKAIIFSLCFNLDNINNTLREFLNCSKYSFYNISYLLAKNLSIELLSKTGNKIDLDDINKKAREIALSSCSHLFNIGEDDRIIKSEKLNEKYNDYMKEFYEDELKQEG